jgi:hypothetical protein
MDSSKSLTVVRVLSLLLSLLATAALSFLGFWYFELILWVVLGPVSITSLYLAWRMWLPSNATRRAVVYWGISIAWAFALILFIAKDVTFTGGALAIAAALGIVLLVYACVTRSIAGP